jgi:hypothetical protein
MCLVLVCGIDQYSLALVVQEPLQQGVELYVFSVSMWNRLVFISICGASIPINDIY